MSKKTKAYEIKLADGAEALKKTNIKIEEIGTSGVEFYAGSIYEDYLYKLNGYQLSEEIDKMYRSDANIKMILSALIYPLKSANWYFKKMEDTPEAEEQELYFNKAFFEYMKPTFTKFLGEALSCLRHGYSLFDITHQIVQDEELGEIITIKGLSFRKQETIIRWNLDKDGNLSSVDQQVQGDRGGLFKLDPEFLLHFSPEQEGQNYMGLSILRQSYGAWIRKNKYLQLMAVGMEKYAVPTPHMEVPAIAADKKEIDKAISALKNYSSGSNNYIVTPEGFKLTFNNVTFDSEKIKSSIQFENTEMANSVLASFLLLGQGETGSRALGDSLSGFFGKSVKFISDHLIEQITLKIMKPLAEMNFGETLKVELCTDALDQTLNKEWADIINSFVSGGLLDNSEELKGIVAGKIGVNRQSESMEQETTEAITEEVTDPTEEAALTQLAEKKKSKKKSPFAVGLANKIDEHLDEYLEPYQIMVGDMAGGYANNIVKESLALSPAAKAKAPSNATPPNQAKVRKFLEMIGVIHYLEAQKKVAPLFKGGSKKKLADPKPSIKLVKVDTAIEEFIKKARGLADAENYTDAVAEIGSILDKNLPTLYSYLPNPAKAEIKSRADVLASINAGDAQKYIDLAYDGKGELSKDDLAWAMDEAVDDFIDKPAVVQGFDSYLVKSVNDSLSQASEDYEKETGIEILSYTSHSVLDDGTTDLCYELDGVTWDVNDPDLNKYWPPSHFGCRRINVPNTSAMKDIPEITGTPKLSIKAQGQLQFSESCECQK